MKKETSKNNIPKSSFPDKKTSGGSAPADALVNRDLVVLSHSASENSVSVSVEDIKYRLAKGWTVEQALGIDPPPNNINTEVAVEYEQNCASDKNFDDASLAGIHTPQVKVENKTYSCVSEAARAYNLDPKDVLSHLSNGWTIEEALKIVPRDKNPLEPKSIAVGDTEYPSIAKAARAYNLNPNNVRSRLNNGWTIEEAFEIVPRLKLTPLNSKPITVEDVEYPSINAAARAYNLDPDKVHARINKGWSIEEAFKIVSRPKSMPSNAKPITVEDVEYPSINAAARAYNLVPDKVHARLNKGWSIEEALEIAPCPQQSPSGSQTIIVEDTDQTPSVSKSTPITVEGTEYPSINAAARAYNLDPNKVHTRLKYGWPIEEALEIIPRPQQTPPGSKSITVEDTEYPSIKAAAHAYNLDPDKVHARLKRGWSIEEAFEIIPSSKLSARAIRVDGKLYPSKTAAACAYNIDLGTVSNRLRLGWSIEEVFGIIPRAKKQSHSKAITIENKIYSSLKLAARAYSVEPRKIYDRLKKGWSIDEAFDIIPRPQLSTRSITIDGKTYPSINAAARAYNIGTSTVCNRLKKGWSIEKAFGLIPHSRVVAKTITVDGKTYPSIKAAANAYNFSEIIIRSRLRHGWSIDEAFEFVPRDRSRISNIPFDNKSKPFQSSKNQPPKAMPVTVNDITYPTTKEACRAYNIYPSTFAARINKGWSVEKALLTPTTKRGSTSITVGSKTYRSIALAAKAYNLSAQVVYDRLAAGWSIDETFSTPTYHGHSVDLNGTTYGSIAEAARAHGVLPDIVNSRLSAGWSLEEALDIVPRCKSSSNRAMPLQVGGKTYPSVAAACQEYGVSPSLYSYRTKKKGMTPEQALGIVPA